MIFCLSDYHRDPLSTSVQKTFQAVFNPVWETVLQKSKLGITRSQSPIQIYKCLCDILSFISVAQIWGSRLLTISAVLWATETILELRNRGDTQEKLRGTRWHSGVSHHIQWHDSRAYYAAPASVWASQREVCWDQLQAHTYSVPLMCACGRPFAATCQARPPWRVPAVLSSVTSCTSHPHCAFLAEVRAAVRATNTHFQICFHLGWQMNAVLLVVLPAPKLLSLLCVHN